jgi:hypothetical protein
MDHNEALRLMATERYLLEELTPAQRDEFEDHFFGCRECALDVRMGAALIANTPGAMQQEAAPKAIAKQPPRRHEWFGWLRPAITLPAMAILLAVIGVQYFAVRPGLESRIAQLEQPQVLGSAYLSSGQTRGSVPMVTAPRGAPFVLFVDVPGEGGAASYVAELYGPAGEKEWSLPISAQTVEAAHGTLPISVTPAHEEAGAYVLVVRNSEVGGTGAELGRYPFELQLR